MNTLLKAAIAILIVSGVLFLWGSAYTQDHQVEGLAGLFGLKSTMYTVAAYSVLAGEILFFVGLALLVGGIALQVQPPKAKNHSFERQGSKCLKCGSYMQGESRFCDQCGAEMREPASENFFCPACGAKLAGDSKFCDICGEKLPF